MDMVQQADGTDVAIFYPDDRLLLDLAQWFHRNSRFHMEVVLSRQTSVMRSIAAQATFLVINATQCLDPAITALAVALECVPCERILLYTERMHEGLELFVRCRGVLMLLGPASQIEWEAALRPAKRPINVAV
jgi:hypothetical protein